MKLLVASATVVALGLLTAGCSSGSGSHAAASTTASATSAAAVAAPSTHVVATSPAAAAPVGSPSAAPSGSPTTAAPSAAGPSEAAVTTASASQAASSSKAPAAATGGSAAPVVVCTTLPTAQAASLSGKALTSSREQDFAANNSYTCAYYTASGFGGISVTVSTVGGARGYANTLSTDTIAGAAEHVTPLAGLGDKAFSARDGVHALFGDRMIYVAGLTAVPPAEAIVKALQAKLT